MIMNYSRRSKIWMGAPCTFTVPGTVVRVVKSISDTSECVPVSFVINVDCWIAELDGIESKEKCNLPSPLKGTRRNQQKQCPFCMPKVRGLTEVICVVIPGYIES